MRTIVLNRIPACSFRRRSLGTKFYPWIGLASLVYDGIDDERANDTENQ
jgi:hypothetical protein